MEYTLSTGCLNDDYITVEDNPEGKWKLVYYTFANNWSDRKHVEYFTTLDDAINYYKDHFMIRLENEALYLSEKEGEEITVESLLDPIYVFFEGEE